MGLITIPISIIKFFLFFSYFHPKLFIFHITFNFLLSIYIYLKMKPFYDPSKSEIHNQYPEFKRLDKLNYPRLLFGLIFLVWPRAIIFVLSMTIMSIIVNIGKDILDPKYKKMKDFFYQKGSKIVLFALGCIITKEIRNEKKSEEIIKKYLGPDYEISYIKKFSCVVSNHVSWVESFYYNYKYAIGYIGKKTASKVPGISHIGRYNQTIYCDRTDPDDRKKVAEKIAERQKGILNGTILTQLAIYPEGTQSNGTHLIKFKRGAFMTLLPIKCIVELIDQSDSCILACGIVPMHFHIVYSCCFLWHYDTFLELPVIEPTEFMFENYQSLGQEKWMIYMEVTKKIMSEVSGLGVSEMSFPEKLEYISKVTGKKVKNT